MNKKSNALTAVFFVMAIASAVSTIPSILNYLEFYRAISRFDLSVTGVKLDNSLLDKFEIVITVNFTISNLAGFSGLTVQSISSKLYYENGVHSVPYNPYKLLQPKIVHASYCETTWWELKYSQSLNSKHLEPYQNATIPVTFHVTPQTQDLATCGTLARFRALDFIVFLNNHKGDINWRLQGVVYLSTFLGAHSISFDICAKTPLCRY